MSAEYVNARLGRALAVQSDLPPRRWRRNFTTAELDLVRSMIAEHATTAEIAKALDRHPKTVHHKLEELGLRPAAHPRTRPEERTWDKAERQDIDWSSCPMAQKYGVR